MVSVSETYLERYQSSRMSPFVTVVNDYKLSTMTAQKMKFSISDLFSKYDQIRRKLRIWSHLLKKSLMENFIFSAL